MPISNSPAAPVPTWWRRHAPVIALLLIAPILSELLSGSTRLSTIFVLIPSTGFWGCAAILIREATVRRGRGWAVVWLGLALALLEECVVQQTSFTPLVGVPPDHAYARWFGVNWIYLLWALGFESIWAVVAPITVVELLFPARRAQPWLTRRGLVINAVIMAAAGFVAWFSWTQIFLPKFYPNIHYHPPGVAIAIALLLIGGLVAVALQSQSVVSPTAANVPPVYAIAVLSFAASLAWFLIILLAFNAVPTLPPQWPLIAGVAVAVVLAWLFRRWSAASAWSDAHRLAAVTALVAGTLVGGIITLRAAYAQPVDKIAHVVFNLVALGALLSLGRKRRLAVGGQT